MSDSIELQEMIFTTITGDFELGAEANNGAGHFSPRNGVLDVVQIAIKVHRPLIQIARSHLEKPHR